MADYNLTINTQGPTLSLGLTGAQGTAGQGVPTGSNGQVQFNLSGVFGADSNFFWDNTNKRLGIGTSSPSGTLTVKSQGLDWNDGIIFEHFSTTNKWQWLHDSPGRLLFAYNSTANLTINGNKVGFGSNNLSPTAIVDILNTSATQLPLKIKAAASQTANLTEWQNSAGTVLNSIDSRGRQKITYSTNYGEADLLTLQSTDNNIWFRPLNIKNAAGASVAGFTATGQLRLTSPANYSMVSLDSTVNGGYPSITFTDATATNTIGMFNGKLVLTAGPYINSSAYVQFSTSGHGASIHASDSSSLYGQGDINAEVAPGAAYPAFHALMRGSPTGTEEAIRVTAGGSYTTKTFDVDYSGLTTISPISATTKGLVVKAAASQTANLTEWQNSAGTALSYIRADGSCKPASLADSSAANDSIYYSTTAGKLVYKDSTGTVNNLY